jgi:23S rRNA (cytosine1962-C5)-methyltransferase
MIREASPDATPGSLVAIYDKSGRPFGTGLYHPRARVPLRVIHHGEEAFEEEGFLRLLDRAADLRLRDLQLDSQTDAFRVIHSDGDSLSGLIVDRYGDVLSVSVHSLGVHQRLPRWIEHLHRRLGTRHSFVEVDPRAARLEGIPSKRNAPPVPAVKIRENGVRYEVDFTAGHKTGFFCDQRENRRRLAQLTHGKRVLDLCCYTGGFALAAKVIGGAAHVTGVDLDEASIAQARRNAHLNQVRVDWIHCDAFTWARQMQRNAERWDVVVLDPPKFVLDREDSEGGRGKYEDLNTLATSLVRADGLFVTCSCSGLLALAEFERIVIKAAHRQARRLQFIDQTGAGPDHPVLSTCPESRYLKVLWARVQ